jgi:hypothetical protein
MQGAGEEDVKRYSPERKEAVLKKLAPPYNLSVPELSQQEGISVCNEKQFSSLPPPQIVPKLADQGR